jgi:hypothetical protein
VNGRDPNAIGHQFQQIASLVAPTPQVTIGFGAQVISTRRVTLTVTDKLGQRWSGRWVVYFHITPTLGGAPDGTNNTVAFVAGQALTTIVANGAYTALTNEDGQLEIDLAVVGPAMRYFEATVIGQLASSGARTWT